MFHNKSVDLETLTKLKKNPHYKLSAAQKQQLVEHERKTMIEFGVTPTHDNHFNKHDTKVKKRKRKKVYAEQI